jgi:hypothetical protein
LINPQIQKNKNAEMDSAFRGRYLWVTTTTTIIMGY